jgi:hypothetical protein
VEDISFEEAVAQTPVEVLPPRGTFPELHTAVEELGRVVDSAPVHSRRLSRPVPATLPHTYWRPDVAA